MKSLTLSMLITLALTTGCTRQYTTGELTTHDGAPLRLSAEGGAGLIHPGTLHVSFATAPLFSADLTLGHANGTLETSVPASAYQGGSFFLSRSDSGLTCDIRASWTQSYLGSYEKSEQARCETPGICSRSVSRLECPNKTYSQYSEGYKKHEDDEGCEYENEWVTEYFPDCPGSQWVMNTYQTYLYALKLEFLMPQRSPLPLAEYNGESGRFSYVVRQRVESACSAGW
ncbi:MAG: hypothetical protein ABWY06_18080 [Pseudomonas sp.]|uniref:hypothetical protein n=1 Tax=Pseudomonas sp. TaxID=306 RepID=UPI003393567B